jgi:hypothetical protein
MVDVEAAQSLHGLVPERLVKQQNTREKRFENAFHSKMTVPVNRLAGPTGRRPLEQSDFGRF